MEGKSKKILVASSAAYILGMNPKVELKGSEKQLKVFKEVLEASKTLYENLQVGSDSQLNKSLHNKKNKAREFKKVFGWQWPF